MDDVGLQPDRSAARRPPSGSGTAWSSAMPRLLDGDLRRRHRRDALGRRPHPAGRRRRARLALRRTTPCTTSRRTCTTRSPGIGAVLGWLVNTFASAVVGLVVGARGRRRDARAADQARRRALTLGAAPSERRASRIPRDRRSRDYAGNRSPPDSSHRGRLQTWTSRSPTSPWPTSAAPRSPSPSTRCPA